MITTESEWLEAYRRPYAKIRRVAADCDLESFACRVALSAMSNLACTAGPGFLNLCGSSRVKEELIRVRTSTADVHACMHARMFNKLRLISLRINKTLQQTWETVLWSCIYDTPRTTYLLRLLLLECLSLARCMLAGRLHAARWCHGAGRPLLL